MTRMKNESEVLGETENIFVEETGHPFYGDHEENNIVLNMGRRKKDDDEENPGPAPAGI